MLYQPLTQIAHEKIRRRLRDGDWAIDATAGNGYDTAFLAEQVGSNGYVHAFDIQTQAIESAMLRLARQGYSKRATIWQKNHADMLSHVPREWHNKVSAITFNLGYLPHSDRSIATCANHTLPALGQSVDLLKAQGILSLLVYKGHAGGRQEFQAVTEWLQAKAGLLDFAAIESRGPTLYFCRKVAR